MRLHHQLSHSGGITGANAVPFRNSPCLSRRDDGTWERSNPYLEGGSLTQADLDADLSSDSEPEHGLVASSSEDECHTGLTPSDSEEEPAVPVEERWPSRGASNLKFAGSGHCLSDGGPVGTAQL